MDEKKVNNFQLTWLPKKTFEILATVDRTVVDKAKKATIAKSKENLEVKGFRKGKAPDSLVAEDLGQNKLLELIIQQLIPDIYSSAISQFGLRPILSPKIELVSAKEGENWQIKFTSCEEPEINLGNYKDLVKKQKSVNSIWTPGKGTPPNGNEKKAEKPENQEENLNKILGLLTENIKVEISDFLVEAEVARKLSEFLEEVKKLGLTLDQYLTSTGKNIDSLRHEYKDRVEQTVKLQLILGAIAESEKIEVGSEEIEKTISSAKNDDEKRSLESQKYLLASILRQQKTLDFLAKL